MKDNNTSIILITEKEKKERKRWKEKNAPFLLFSPQGHDFTFH